MTNNHNTLNPYFSKAPLVANRVRSIHSTLIRLFKKNEISMSLKINTPTAMNMLHPLCPPPAGDIPRTNPC